MHQKWFPLSLVLCLFFLSPSLIFSKEETPLKKSNSDYVFHSFDENHFFHKQLIALSNSILNNYLFCPTDTDGDGVCDDNDADDDNDGIADAVEFSYCQIDYNYNFFEKGKIILTTNAGISGDINVLRDGNNLNNSFYYTGNFQNVAGKTYVQMEFPNKPITLKGFEIGVGAWLFANGTVMKVEASNDFVNWTELLVSTRTSAQPPCIYGNCGIAETFDFSGNSNAYRIYRLVGISGTTRQFPWVNELYFNIDTSPNACDLDGDGIANHLDLDSDNDGIPDNVEGQATFTYAAPNNDTPTQYTNNNGINSAYGSGLIPPNFDGDGCEDYLDVDTDNDGIWDYLESGISFGGGVGINGLENNAESVDNYTDVNGNINDPKNDLPSAIPGVTDVFYRKIPAPGGVDANLSYWFKANFGTSTTINGAGVNAWFDQSSVGNHVFQGDGARFPLFAENAMNFNPALTFDGINDELLDVSPIGLATGSTPLTVYGVAASSLSGAVDYISTWGTNVNFQWMALGKNGDNSFVSNFANDITGAGNIFASGTPVMLQASHNGTTLVLEQNGGSAGSTNNGIPNIVLNGGGLLIGSNTISNAENYAGNIGESFAYSRDLTDLEEQRVNTYLAVKYGITIDQTTPVDYLASDGSTKIWDATVNATYKHDIAGIGRDDLSGLKQKQSISASENIVAVGLGGVAHSNALNITNFAADKSFLIWGHNGAAINFVNLLVNDHHYASRIWKVQETGTVGVVQIRVPKSLLNGSQPMIIRSTDATITSSDQQTILAEIGGFLYASIDFADGDYFTFAQAPPPAPGGVTANLNFWIKADLGALDNGTAITTWLDQSGNDHNSTFSHNTPHLQGNQINFNPGVDFDGNEAIQFSTIDINPSVHNPKDFYFVYNEDVDGALIGNDNNFWDVIIGSHYMAADGNAYTAHAATASIPGVPTLLNVELHHGVVNGSKVLANGSPLPAFTHANAEGGNPVGTEIGANGVGGGTADFFDGRISEIIMYSNGGAQSVVDRHKIQSYLAIKYGITLDPIALNYLASDGTTHPWNDLSYWNAITIIGRDDKSGLHQKQSRGANSYVNVSLGNFIAIDNASNTNAFEDDLSFFAFGHDGGTFGWTTVGSPDNRTEIIGQVFKVKETGNVGEILLSALDHDGPWANELPDEGDDRIFFLVDDDTDFTTGATVIPATLYGTDWVANTPIDFTDGQYFTIAKKFVFDFDINAESVTCNGPIANSDGKITLTKPTPASYKVGFSSGTTYSGPIYGAALDGGTFPFTVTSGLPNPTFEEFYTVRVYKTEVIFEDFVVNLSPKVCAYSDISISTTPAIQSAFQSELVTYEVKLTNAGPDPGINVKVRVTIPDEVEFVAANATTGNFNANNEFWTLDQVPVGDETLTITYRMK